MAQRYKCQFPVIIHLSEWIDSLKDHSLVCFKPVLPNKAHYNHLGQFKKLTLFNIQNVKAMR